MVTNVTMTVKKRKEKEKEAEYPIPTPDAQSKFSNYGPLKKGKAKRRYLHDRHTCTFTQSMFWSYTLAGAN